MAQTYLWANTVIFALLGAACALNPDRLARASGYFTLDNSGRSEFLAIYAGLDLGLAAFYAAAALKPNLRDAAITFSLCLYGGLAAFRLPSLLLYRPVRPLTYALAAVEVALLLGATWLTWKRNR